MSQDIGRPGKTSPALAHPTGRSERRVGTKLPPRQASHGILADQQRVIVAGEELGDRGIERIEAAGIGAERGQDEPSAVGQETASPETAS